MEIRKDNGQFILHFSASQPDNYGTRITTGPVKLTIDGKHKINMGNITVEVVL